VTDNRYTALVEVTAPPVEPVTLAVARTHCRVIAYGSPPSNPEDALISDVYLPAAREWVEGYLRRTLVQRTRRICYGRWGRALELLMPPVQSVTSVEYVDANGNVQTLAPDQYIVDLDAFVPRIVPASGVVWPELSIEVPNAVRITYVAGYPAVGSPPDFTAAIPKKFAHAILVVLGDLFENREATTTAAGVTMTVTNKTAENLLYQDRVFTL